MSSSSSTSSVGSPCFVCDEIPPDIKKLKTHLLLKHSKMNLCLFCVENKGWSDNFASQSSYNTHYWEKHEGVIEAKEKRKQEIRDTRRKEREQWREERKSAVELGISLPKKPCRKLLCLYCPRGKPEFEESEYDRHLIAVHGHDYCKLCSLMGPRLAVRLHIAKGHSSKLCHVCCSNSPKFSSLEAVRHHMLNKHQPHDKSDKPFPCYDCIGNSSDGQNQLEIRFNKNHDKLCFA